MQPGFIDSHTHLVDEAFRLDLTETLARAFDAGLTDLVVPGTEVGTSEQALELADREPRVHPAVGIHPHEASAAGTAGLERIVRLSSSAGVVAIGEIGLDFHYDFSPRERQFEVFRQQIDLAIERDLPIIVHTRESMEDAIAIVEGASHRAPKWCGGLKGRRGVFHCFTGTAEQARRLFAVGFYVSYPGILTFKRSPVLATLKEIGLERVLLETDAPYLAPVPLRGKRNEPSYLVHTARCMAEATGRPLDEVAEITSRNARDLFRLTAPLS